MPSRKHKRYKLLLDESLPPRTFYPQANNLHDLKHIKHDLHRGGISDREVYQIASIQNRLVVVFNKKDFKPLVQATKPSIVFLSPALSNKQVDLKLCKMLGGLTKSELTGHLIYLSNRKQIMIKRIIDR